MVKNAGYGAIVLGSESHLCHLLPGNKLIAIMGDFTTLFLIVDSTSSRKFIKNMKNLNGKICKLNPADIFGTLNPAT